MRHATVQFGKNTIIKTADPELMRVEVEKTRRAFEIGRASGLFRVPEVLDYDEAGGVATFELVQGLRTFVSSINRNAPFAERVGMALAVVHRELSLPPSMVFPLPEHFNVAGTEVFFHRDFNGKNVCLQAGSGSIVILDWQMTWHHGGKATYGSRFFDLIWFMDYLIWAPKYSHLFHDPVVPVAKTFLSAYFSEAAIPYDPKAFETYAREFFERDLPQRKGHVTSPHRYLLFRASQSIKERFLEYLSGLEGPARPEK
ncbi:MAG: hypothetical protein JXR72_07095 [Proteobacteria bacterium]|nr:hypothetical protein [Pseudomonadota bacterium]